jgi:hypothetical protein
MNQNEKLRMNQLLNKAYQEYLFQNLKHINVKSRNFAAFLTVNNTNKIETLIVDNFHLKSRDDFFTDIMLYPTFSKENIFGFTFNPNFSDKEMSDWLNYCNSPEITEYRNDLKVKQIDKTFQSLKKTDFSIPIYEKLQTLSTWKDKNWNDNYDILTFLLNIKNVIKDTIDNIYWKDMSSELWDNVNCALEEINKLEAIFYSELTFKYKNQKGFEEILDFTNFIYKHINPKDLNAVYIAYAVDKAYTDDDFGELFLTNVNSDISKQVLDVCSKAEKDRIFSLIQDLEDKIYPDLDNNITL